MEDTEHLAEAPILLQTSVPQVLHIIDLLHRLIIGQQLHLTIDLLLQAIIQHQVEFLHLATALLPDLHPEVEEATVLQVEALVDLQGAAPEDPEEEGGINFPLFFSGFFSE